MRYEIRDEQRIAKSRRHPGHVLPGHAFELDALFGSEILGRQRDRLSDPERARVGLTPVGREDGPLVTP